MSQNMNTIANGLATFAARPNRFDMSNKPNFPIETLYRPHFPDNYEY